MGILKKDNDRNPITREMINNKGENLIEDNHKVYIRSTVAEESLDFEDIEDFGRMMYNELFRDKPYIEYHEYINNIIKHYNYAHGTPKDREVKLSKMKIKKKENDNDIETEILICISIVLFINFMIIMSVHVFHMVLRKVYPNYFASGYVSTAFSFLIFSAMFAGTYHIGYKNHFLKPYCNVGFKRKQRYKSASENTKVLASFVIIASVLLLLMSKHVLKTTTQMESYFISFIHDPLFFLFNSMLACWPSLDEPGYSKEKHKRLNRNTLRNLILNDYDDDIQSTITREERVVPAAIPITSHAQEGPTKHPRKIIEVASWKASLRGGAPISGVAKFFYSLFYIIAIFMFQSVYTSILVIVLFYIVSKEVSGSYSNLSKIGCTL